MKLPGLKVPGSWRLEGMEGVGTAVVFPGPVCVPRVTHDSMTSCRWNTWESSKNNFRSFLFLLHATLVFYTNLDAPLTLTHLYHCTNLTRPQHQPLKHYTNLGVHLYQCTITSVPLYYLHWPLWTTVPSSYTTAPDLCVHGTKYLSTTPWTPSVPWYQPPLVHTIPVHWVPLQKSVDGYTRPLCIPLY